MATITLSDIVSKADKSYDGFLNQQTSALSFAVSTIIRDDKTYREHTNGNVFVVPKTENILRALTVPADKVKCVIVGMDPYSSVYREGGTLQPEATGRSFEVASVESWLQPFKQASLRNILKTLYYHKTGLLVDIENVRSAIANGEFILPSPHQWFDKLEAQGVMFLNSSLTTIVGEAGFHSELWENFSEDLARFLVQTSPDAKWILAGKDAQGCFEDIIPKYNQVLCVHPRLADFVLQCPFNEINEIDWC